VQQSLEWWKASGGVLIVPYYHEMLSRTQKVLGHLDDAVHSINLAIDCSEKSAENWLTGELHRYKGELLAGNGSYESQVVCFEKALSITQKQGSRILELRAATSLARTWSEKGDRQKALDLLAPLYGWFSEGFDTVDLKQSKALLDELA